jgi:hypothetical protein
MTLLERHCYAKTKDGACMAPFWSAWTAASGLPIRFAGVTSDQGAPVLYIIAVTAEDKTAVERALSARWGEIAAEITACVAAGRGKDLLGFRDLSWYHPQLTEFLTVHVFQVAELEAAEAARLAEEFRRSPGKSVGARHKDEISSIEDYSPVEYHVLYRSEAIYRECMRNGFSSAIEEEIIAHLHGLGRTEQTLENTRFHHFSADNPPGIDFFR